MSKISLMDLSLLNIQILIYNAEQCLRTSSNYDELEVSKEALPILRFIESYKIAKPIIDTPSGEKEKK